MSTEESTRGPDPLPFTERERSELLERIAVGMAETSSGFLGGAALFGGLFFAIALVFLFRGAPGIAAIVAVCGAGLALIGWLAARRTSPERMRPVLLALNEEPERITLVRHYETSDSRHTFVTHWIEIKTADHRLVVKADRDWRTLLDQLTSLCPAAEVKRG